MCVWVEVGCGVLRVRDWGRGVWYGMFELQMHCDLDLLVKKSLSHSH